MVKNRSIKKRSINKYPQKSVKEVLKTDNFGGFQLNPNGTDRISFNRETNKNKKTVKISNVS